MTYDINAARLGGTSFNWNKKFHIFNFYALFQDDSACEMGRKILLRI